MARMTLTAARELLGWSVRQLAREAGESPSNIADLEAGRNTNPSYRLVSNIVAALRRGGLKGATAEDLFGAVAVGQERA